MGSTGSFGRTYLLAAFLGVISWSLSPQEPFPKMMSQMMAGMVQNMIAQTEEAGCDPAEM